MRYLLCVLLLSGILFSCASPPRRIDVSYTSEFFQSADGFLRGRVPIGWFVPQDSAFDGITSVVLVREDYALAVTLQEIQFDLNSVRRIEQDGSTLLAHLSFLLQKERYPQATMIGTPAKTILRGINASSYWFIPTPEQSPLPVMVFGMRGHYFESCVVTLKDGLTISNPRQIAQVQEAIVASLM